ncbi:helix-turn-helix domain-containing protein [Aromatoleum toluvorans]|uniref:Helix-turn-helix domain-containing protein n=1 Tax=Aromatoleum toluvorans TaxID=92002 RepID=A0ABX1Q2Z8_9RHOO|nr:GlxA family transcriptional regulator [Aromatoleum toluvorans]NMG46083.1 helix-turn-helix domain-containing protein [Aromatoleum toluvorans]
MGDNVRQASRSFDSRMRHSNQAYLQGGAPHDAHPPICRRIGFVLLEHFSMMAFTGAVDALVTANLVSRQPLYRFETYSLEGATVRSDLGINISVDAELPALDAKDLDILIICGGFRSNLEPRRPVVDKLREVARRQAILGSLWNGSYLLAHAGLLDGYTCTVHPDSRAGLEELRPQVRLLPNPFVIDRDRISSAGANSALGMMLAVIRHHHGDEMVRGIEEILACDRTLDDLPDSPMPTLVDDPTFPDALQTILQLMKNNIEEPLSIEELALRARISRRRIDRLFQRHLDTTPSRYYLETRLTRARRLLQQTNEPITSIAIACGFTSAPHFSRCYREFFGVSPSQVSARHRRG